MKKIENDENKQPTNIMNEIQQKEEYNRYKIIKYQQQKNVTSKLSQLYAPKLNIYFIPQQDNINSIHYQPVWHGIIFVRNGIYKDGKFKFKIIFPKEFPQFMPKIFFMNEIYHCLIDIQTGQLDLEVHKLLQSIITQWNYIQQHLLYNMLKFFPQIFSNTNFMKIQGSFNQQAAYNFQNNLEQYFFKVIQNVQDSKQKLYENYNYTSFKVTIIKQISKINDQHQYLISQLKDICNNKYLTYDQKKQKFKEQLLMKKNKI